MTTTTPKTFTIELTHHELFDVAEQVDKKWRDIDPDRSPERQLELYELKERLWSAYWAAIDALEKSR